MTNVVVVKQKKIVITQNSNTQMGLDTTNPITIKNTIGYNAQSFRLDHLNDVVEQNPVAGDTLVYDASNDKYIVKRLNLSDVNIDVAVDIDGGSF